MPHAALIIFPCIKIFRRFSQRTLLLCACEMRLYCLNDGKRNLILNCEDILEFSILTFSPNVFIFYRINELGRNAPPIADAPHAAFYDVSHTQAFADFPNFELLSLEGEG